MTAPVRAEWADRAERLSKKGQILHAPRHISRGGDRGPSEKAKERERMLRAAIQTKWVSAKEKAKRLGRSYTYVKDHARELGGRKTRLGRWEFPA